MFYTYILRSKLNNSFYVGSCNDIKIRLDQHNNGLVKSTKRYIHWELVYFEKFYSLKDAKKRELQIKKCKKRTAIERLIKHFKNLE